jgi:hypothetical protein
VGAQQQQSVNQRARQRRAAAAVGKPVRLIVGKS